MSHGGREVYLLHIDKSAGSCDISYDAWNYLGFGKNATEDPRGGGEILMQYEFVEPKNCLHLIDTPHHKLPLSAANSMNFLTECLGQPSSWVAQNHHLYNIINTACDTGFDELCFLAPGANQPTCPNPLGMGHPLPGLAVKNIEYLTGKLVHSSSITK